MNQVEATEEPHLGKKRPDPPVETNPQSPNSPKKKRPKLDSAAQGLLTEIFALQDTLSENEIEALARKVKSTRTQVVNFFNSWKASVNVLVEKSKNKATGFHTRIVTTQQRQQVFPDEGAADEALLGTTTALSETVLKHETIPTSRVDSERLALQLVTSATASRHNAAATLAPFLDSQGGVKDVSSAVNISAFAHMTATLPNPPTFTGQLQLCDALLATREPHAYTFLNNSANVASALQTIVTRSVKNKQITLVVRALHAMIHFRGFKKEFLNHKTLQLLRSIAVGGAPRQSTFIEGAALHPAVKEATRKLLALYPDELFEAAQEDAGNEEAQQQQVEEAKEEAKAPYESAEPTKEDIPGKEEEQELVGAVASEEKDTVVETAQQEAEEVVAAAAVPPPAF